MSCNECKEKEKELEDIHKAYDKLVKAYADTCEENRKLKESKK